MLCHDLKEKKKKSNILAFKEKAVRQSAKQLGISDPLSVTSECRGSSLKGSNLSCLKSDICVQHSCEVACTKNLKENAKNWREPTECVGNWWWWLFPHVHGFWEYVPQLIPHQHFFFFKWRLARAHWFHSLGQDQSTVAQWAETTVTECSPTSCV